MTRQDMLNTLAGEDKAEVAIYWFAYSWHRGKGSDLYTILKQSPYTPDWQRDDTKDPDVQRLLSALDASYPQALEADYQPVHIDSVEVGDILIAGQGHLCLPNRWPCKVYPWDKGNRFAVVCRGTVDDHRKFPEHASFLHPLKVDIDGWVIGFRR